MSISDGKEPSGHSFYNSSPRSTSMQFTIIDNKYSHGNLDPCIMITHGHRRKRRVSDSVSRLFNGVRLDVRPCDLYKI